jgi:hypothetical protein
MLSCFPDKLMENYNEREHLDFSLLERTTSHRSDYFSEPCMITANKMSKNKLPHGELLALKNGCTMLMSLLI